MPLLVLLLQLMLLLLLLLLVQRFPLTLLSTLASLTPLLSLPFAVASQQLPHGAQKLIIMMLHKAHIVYHKAHIDGVRIHLHWPAVARGGGGGGGGSCCCCRCRWATLAEQLEAFVHIAARDLRQLCEATLLGCRCAGRRQRRIRAIHSLLQLAEHAARADQQILQVLGSGRLPLLMMPIPVDLHATQVREACHISLHVAIPALQGDLQKRQRQRQRERKRREEVALERLMEKRH